MGLVAPPDASAGDGRGWYRELTRYHWFVFIVAALGWMFDCLDQQLFNLARAPAMKELLANDPGKDLNEYGGYATAIFLMGWAAGGIGFGILGDRIGRAKTMTLTILVYSIFTGFSAFSQSFWDFAVYRFLTGLGVGGEFAVGVALVAEVMPDRARPFALGLLQALSAVGNISAAFISIYLGHLEEAGALGNLNLWGTQLTAWRIMFVIGTLPALLVIVIRRRLKEPDRWQHVAHEGAAVKQLGSFRELFGDPRWRHNAIVGVLLASSGVIGLWGIGFFSIDFNRSVFRGYYHQEARAAGQAELDRQFIKLAIEHPEELKVAKGFQPVDLINPDRDPRHRDADRLYAAVLALVKANKTVSEAAVLDALDPQSSQDTASEDRARREAYLAVEPPAGATIAGEVKRIAERTKEISGSLTRWGGITSLMLNLGAFFGIYTFSRVTHRIGRRKAFALAFTSAMFSTALVFGFLSDRTVDIYGRTLFVDVFWMIPLMGFCLLSIFGGYAIYFPELFPTRLRSTGTSFCYNVGRFVAAVGPFTLGALAAGVFKDKAEPLRWAGLSMCSIFLLGLAVLPFAPETKGKPLPE